MTTTVADIILAHQFLDATVSKMVAAQGRGCSNG